ncbi:hypothetical protein [Salmonella enterica]
MNSQVVGVLAGGGVCEESRQEGDDGHVRVGNDGCVRRESDA